MWTTVYLKGYSLQTEIVLILCTVNFHMLGQICIVGYGQRTSHWKQFYDCVLIELRKDAFECKYIIQIHFGVI